MLTEIHYRLELMWLMLQVGTIVLYEPALELVQ